MAVKRMLSVAVPWATNLPLISSMVPEVNCKVTPGSTVRVFCRGTWISVRTVGAIQGYMFMHICKSIDDSNIIDIPPVRIIAGCIKKESKISGYATCQTVETLLADLLGCNIR